jgi:hypothetical protein
MILDEIRLSSCGLGETLSERLYFSEIFINFIMAFLNPRHLVCLHNIIYVFPKAAVVVIKQFRKATKKSYKKPNFIRGFRNPFNG